MIRAPGGAEWVTERDAAAVRVHVTRLPAAVEPGVGEGLQDDGRERFVDLDHLDVVPREPRTAERLGARQRIAVKHAERVDPGDPEGDEPRTRLEPEP